MRTGPETDGYVQLEVAVRDECSALSCCVSVPLRQACGSEHGYKPCRPLLYTWHVLVQAPRPSCLDAAVLCQLRIPFKRIT